MLCFVYLVLMMPASLIIHNSLYFRHRLLNCIYWCWSVYLFKSCCPGQCGAGMDNGFGE